MRLRGISCAVATCLAVFSGADTALAQAVQPATVSSNGVFFSADYGYRSIKTPSYSLGAREVAFPSFGDGGPLYATKPRVTGEGGQVSLGMILPPGSSFSAFGSNARLTLNGGLYSADASQTGFSDAPFPAWALLNGSLEFGCGCTASLLTTRQSGWNIGLNAASDFNYGPVTLTPSVEIVGGSNRRKQSLTQVALPDIYEVNTRLSWHDAGLKFGLGFSIPLAATVEWGFSGTASVLYRRASLNGSDALSSSGVQLGQSSIDVDASTWAFVPGVQSYIAVRPSQNLQVRILGGVEWDTRAPRIVSPQIVDFLVPQGSPAGVGFATQTTYFVGGGFTYAFNR